jgi:uncharacterized membrane protein
VSERGAIAVLAAAIVALALLGVVLAGDAARLVVLRTSAQTAADAAALAAGPLTFESTQATAPVAEAARFAAANGATLIFCDCPVDPVWRPRTVIVEVEVEVQRSWLGVTKVVARAAAEFDPTVWLTMP